MWRRGRKAAGQAAPAWVMLIHGLPSLSLTSQLNEITIWIGKEGGHRPRAWPTVAVLLAPRQAGQPGSQAPATDQRQELPGRRPQSRADAAERGCPIL
jgi:hypothetical protein